MNANDVIEMMSSPLVQTGRTGSYLRMVLAEAGQYGMPGNVIVMLDDLAAMLGFYEPMQPSQTKHLAGPLVTWRTHPQQPTWERIHDVEALAFKQRALIAFGGAPPDHMVGTAEIAIAMGNILKGTAPDAYYEVYTWASIDVLKQLTHRTEEDILSDDNKKKWKHIPDDEVLKPGGRLYPTYQEVCTTIRRTAIEAMDQRSNNPRVMLRPLASRFLDAHKRVRPEAIAAGLTDVATGLDRQIDLISKMFPDLGTMEEEVERFNRNVELSNSERKVEQESMDFPS